MSVSMSDIMKPGSDKENGKHSSRTAWADFFWLLGYAKPIWFLFACVLLFSLISSGAKSGMAFLIGPFVDEVIGEKSMTMLQDIAIILICLAAISALGQYYFLYLSRMVREKIMVSMRTDVFERLLNLPLSFYSKQKQGDIISRVTNDIQVSRKALHSILTKLLKEPVMAVVAIGVALQASIELTIIALIVAPLVSVPVLLFAKKVNQYKKKGLLKLGDVVESLNQILSGIRVVRIFQAEEKEKEQFREQNEKLLDRNVSVIQYKALSRSTLRLLVGFLVAGFLFGGAWLVIADNPPIEGLTKGNLVQFIAGIWLLYQPTKKLTQTYNKLQESLAGVRRIRELLHEDHLKENVPEGPRKLDRIEDGVSIRNMSFAYDSDPVLKDINVDIDRGSTVALVGPSGAGKSTLMDIIARFYHPQEGQILIDGHPVEEIDRTSFVDRISIVSQDAYLFNTTIEQNIKYGSQEATHQEVVNASKMANIHEFITSLEDGYETNVGERGVRLSGGQKQRITIARALLEDPELLLLDEATSDLDTQSEQEIQEAMEKLLEGRTCVIIAHRLSTILNADQILVLDDGRIVQRGTHDELLHRDGLYAELYQYQFSNQEQIG